MTVTLTNIDKALAHSKSYTDYSRREELLEESRRLTSLRDGLLPVEEAAKESLEKRLDHVVREIELLDLSKEFGSIPVLSQEVFSWTKMQPGWRSAFGWSYIDVPALAYLPVTAEACEISVNRHGRIEINGDNQYYSNNNPRVPWKVDKHYREIARQLGRRHCSDRREIITLTYSYAGIIPADIRDVIHTEKQARRFDDLAFVCDADRWQVGVTEIPRVYFDPILVGLKAGALWVLATFDPTPVESYIASEFTS